MTARGAALTPARPPVNVATVYVNQFANRKRSFGMATNGYAPTVLPVLNTQAGATYTLILPDAGAVVEMTYSGASACELTVPALTFPTGTIVEVRQLGTTSVHVLAASGVTLRSPGGATRLRGQFSEASLMVRGAADWVLVGDLTT